MAIQQVKTGAAVNDGTGDDARTAFTKINQNFTDSANAASRQVGTEGGDVMEVGAFGLGSSSYYDNGNPYDMSPEKDLSINRFMAFGDIYGYGYPMGINMVAAGDKRVFLGFSSTQLDPLFIKLNSVKAPAGSREINFYYFRTTKNTTVDPNGFIKNASPVVSLYADKIELNDEAKEQDIIFEKMGVGDYLVKGSTGFAQEGWYIEMPKDANGNVLVAVVYEQLANNDISVKTYDYMLNKKGRIVPDLETPINIPEARWIDIRLQELPQPDITPTDETVNTNAE